MSEFPRTLPIVLQRVGAPGAGLGQHCDFAFLPAWAIPSAPWVGCAANDHGPFAPWNSDLMSEELEDYL